MQKQSKNYIARAKRSVQSGQAPDEELLHKARGRPSHTHAVHTLEGAGGRLRVWRVCCAKVTASWVASRVISGHLGSSRVIWW